MQSNNQRNNLYNFNDNVCLNDIFLGYADGEREAKKDNFLDLFYVGNNKYRQILSNPSTFIISGKKGTGKTILAKYIEKKDKDDNYICKLSKMSDFNLRCLIDLNLRDLQDKELDHFWKWTILIGITELILERKPKLYNIHQTIAYYKLQHFYNNLYKNCLYKSVYKTTTIEKNNGLKIKNGLKSELKNQIASLGNSTDTEKAFNIKTNFEKAEYYFLLKKLNSLVLDCLNYYKISLIYDDLDGIDTVLKDDASYRNLLISLLNVIKNLNMEFMSIPNIKVRLLVVIRDDILKMLHSYNSNLSKLTNDSELTLYWLNKDDPNHPENHELMDLILTKVRKGNPAFTNMSNLELYERLFPDKIDGKNVVDYLLNFSYGRPRDIITYLNTIQKGSPYEQCFKASLFRQYKVDYSIKFYTELRNELTIHYKSEFVDDCLKLVGDLKKIYFTYDIISDYFNQNKDSYPNILDIKQCIDFLYEFSIIGNSWQNDPSKRRSKYKYSWAYRPDGSQTPNYTLTFVIHNALQKHYSL